MGGNAEILDYKQLFILIE